MKNTTLLKVLSATAIFSAIAAIEAYDQDSFAYAAETPVVASNPATATAPTAVAPTTPATTTTAPATAVTAPAAATSTTSAHNAEEPATVPQDVKALKDGEYKITAEALKFYEEGSPSMAAAAIDNDKTKLIVKNGQYSVNVSFKPITFGGLTGYLGDLKYYDGDKTHENRKEIQNNEFKDSTIVENYSASETDNFVDAYKKQFPNRTVYPKTVNYNVDKNKIDSNNKLETYTEVFVPVMASINPAFGTQKMTLKFDLTSLSRKKVTADNYQAATYDNPNKDVEYKGEIKKPFPIHVQGHFRNANNNDEESLYGSALDSYVKVEKVGDKYKYTLRFKKGLADVGGEFYPFELHKVAYQGKDIPLTTLATNGNSSVKEGSIITDKLLEKIQLDGTAPYPNGALMSHFVTLQLYYVTATPYTERPAKIEDVVAPTKPKPATPAPTPVKPKEDPTPAAPTVADHAVTADKVPTTFPTTVKGELYGRTTGKASIYEKAFVKDVKVEKVGDKYQYTIQVKEGQDDSNFLMRNKPFTVSKLTYKGTEVSFTEVDAATKLKEGKILTDSLLDKIQVDAVMSVRTKGGAKPRYEERNADSTINLEFPTVEATKEEAANNLVPAKIYDASVADKLSMSDGALVHEKTRVEKVNDTYHYYLTFKNLQFGALVGTVDSLSVDGKAAERTDLGGEGNEKLFHFTSAEKLTEKTINFAVLANGEPLKGHSNVPATLNFNWNAATPLTVDQVTAAHQEETTKAQAQAAKVQAEKERLEREKAEAARAQAEKERLEREKAEAARAQAEKERLEREKAEAARAQAEKERLEREKAEAARAQAEKERLEKEAAEAARAQAEKERLEREKAEAARAQAEKERLEKERLEREKALKEAVEKIQAENKETVKEAEAAKETVTKLEADKAQLEKLVKEKEEAINNATTEAEKEKLSTEKAAVEKELTAKVTELKAENENVVKLENKVNEIKQLEEVKTEAVGKIQAENKETVKEAEAAKETVTKLETAKAQLEKLVKEKEEAINNATTEAEKEKLSTEKAAVEKELTAKVTELKTETEKAVKLENKVNEIKQLEAIVKTASLKDTLVAKVEENGSSEKVTVTFNNAAINADHLVVQKANEKTVADVKEKVEELAKKADKNLSVVKTIDLHFADSNGNEINKQGETRAVTVAVVANEGEKLEVYYVRETVDKNIVLEKVPSVYKDGNLTFFTNHFSRYTIVKEKEGETDQNTSVPVTPTPSTDSTKPVVTDENEAPTQPELPALDLEKTNKGEALIQPELPTLNINELSKEQNVKEEAEATAQNIFGQVDNKENKNVEVEKTVAQNTSQTVATGLKQLAKTGLNATATAGLGVLALLSALVLRRRNNK